MKENFIKEKLKNEKKKKARNDKILKIFIFIFLAGNIFFFTSNYTFPVLYKNLEVAKIGKQLDLENYTLTLNSWDYCKKENAFEIILTSNNLTLNKDIKYDFLCRDRDKLYSSKLYKKIGKNMIVVRISGVSKRWREISLDCTLGKNTVSLNMNDKKVNRVSSFKNKSEIDYKIHASKSLIWGMNENIKDLQKEVKEIDSKINLAYERLDTLDSQKKNQTDNEKKITDNNKSKLASELEKLKGTLDDKMQEIEEYKHKINIQKDILDKLEEGA